MIQCRVSRFFSLSYFKQGGVHSIKKNNNRVSSSPAKPSEKCVSHMRDFSVTLESGRYDVYVYIKVQLEQQTKGNNKLAHRAPTRAMAVFFVLWLRREKKVRRKRKDFVNVWPTTEKLMSSGGEMGRSHDSSSSAFSVCVELLQSSFMSPDNSTYRHSECRRLYLLVELFQCIL